jgi:predicted RNA-binding Zn-ribbon protein involved in translation (DUF1610 family)
MPQRQEKTAQQYRDEQTVYLVAETIYRLAANKPTGELVDLHPEDRARYLQLIRDTIDTAKSWHGTTRAHLCMACGAKLSTEGIYPDTHCPQCEVIRHDRWARYTGQTGDAS